MLKVFQQHLIYHTLNSKNIKLTYYYKGNKQLNERVENLVFRGGGMKGIAYCGALDVIASIGMLDHVKR